MSTKKVHYAWIICIGASLMMYLSYGVMANVFSLYVPFIVEKNGYTYSGGTFLITVRSLASIMSIPVVNTLSKRLGVRCLCGISIALMVFSRILYAIGNSYILYIVASAITGVCYVLSGIVPVAIIITNWFRSSKNFALGICSAGSGVANITMSPILTAMLQTMSLTQTFIIEGLIILIIGLVIVLIIRNTPEEKGLSRYYNQKEDEKIASRLIKPIGQNISIGWWMLVLVASFLFAGPASAGFINLPVLFDSVGYDSVTVGVFTTFIGAAIIIGKLTYGRITDKIGGFGSNFVCCASMIVAMALFSFGLKSIGLVAPAVGIFILGFGIVLSTTAQSTWSADLSSEEDFGKRFSQVSFMFMMGGFVHNLITTAVVGASNSYIPAYIMFFIMTWIGFIIIQFAYFFGRKVS